MAKTLLLAKPITTLILLIGLFFVPKTVFATDVRVLKVSKYLSSHNSQLKDYAADFVKYADKYNLDYRLLVSISGVESTFGKYYLPKTYNAYGWGGGKIYFKSLTHSLRISPADLTPEMTKICGEFEPILIVAFFSISTFGVVPWTKSVCFST